MKILDSYILRRFVSILIFAVIAFLLIVIVVDLIGNLGKFLDRNVPKDVIVQYYLVYTPFIVVLVLPIAVLLSSLFSVGQMARYNELTAIRSAGIPLYRAVAPVLAFSVFISLSALYFGETIVPQTNRQKTEIEKEYLETLGKHLKTKVTNIFMRDELNRLIFIGYFDTRDNTAHKVSIERHAADRFIERLDAQEMQWRDSTWVLLGGYQRTFSDSGETAKSFAERPANLLDFYPEQLAETQISPEDMSYGELKNFIREVIRNGGNPRSWLVDLNLKVSVPFASCIMTLLGVSLASNRKRSGVIAGIIISFLVSFLYFGMIKLFQTLGYNGNLPPTVSAWLANGVFLALGGFFLFSTRK
ncbi:MAG: YjgP/YjgQ family permease [Calditrichaeota bacterium]|nr:MAG: YjgP/YjgQ family permease [Calditrichota bacterium]